MTTPVEMITVSKDGYGVHVVLVVFAHTLSENDPRPEFNLGYQWASIRRRARKAVIDFLTEREQSTSETVNEARERIRSSLGRLDVHHQRLDSMNRWHGVTFREADL